MRLSSDIRRYDYALTEEGKEMFQRIKVSLRQEEPVLLKQLVRKAGKLKQLSIPQAIALSKKCSGIQSSN
jgi:DNA-binding PadR family transcriptional regulator